MDLSTDDIPWFKVINQQRVLNLISNYDFTPSDEDWATSCLIIEEIYGKIKIGAMDIKEIENNIALSKNR